MKKLIVGLLILTSLSFPLFAQGQTEDEQLTVYAGMEESHGAKVCQAFEAETGIKTSYVRMSGGEIFARIKAEKENPQASVWYGGGSLTFIEADKLGLLEHYVSPVAANFPDQFKDKNGAWTGIYSGYLGFYGDKEWFDENNLELPKTWDELLNPAFKGEIVMAHPGSSSTAYNVLVTILQLKGEKEGWEYLNKLHQNIRQYTKSGSGGGRMVQLHETGLTIGYLHDAIAFKREGYDHIIMTAPEDGTGYEVGAVGIIKNSPNQGAAKKFVDFVLSAEVQEIGQTVNALQFLTNPDAVPPVEAQQLKGTKLIVQDDEWAGANRTAFVERFNDLTMTKPL